nr:hypothetical protein [Tanacetum cinerariifolium]
MLTGKWTPVNREVGRFNSLVNKTKALTGENDEDLMTRTSTSGKSRFEKRKMKLWTGYPTWNPSSLETTNCPVYLASEELQKVKLDRLFRSRPDNVSRNAPTTIRVRPEGKMERLDRETMARVELFNSLKLAEDLKLLQIDTRGMDPVDAAIINAQKARIQALYEPRN